MITFSIPGSHLARLKLLALAADKKGGTCLDHIHLRISTKACRFTATDGKCLVMVRADYLDNPPQEGCDIILDGAQFTLAMTMLAKAKARTVFFSLPDPRAKQVQVGFGSTQCIVATVDGTFPNVSHMITRGAKAVWEPATGCMDSKYTSLVQKLSGSEEVVKYCQEKDFARGAWWTDDTMAALVMYLTLPDVKHYAPNVGPFDIAPREADEFAKV